MNWCVASQSRHWSPARIPWQRYCLCCETSIRLSASPQSRCLGTWAPPKPCSATCRKSAFPRIARYGQWRQAVPEGEVAWAAIARIAMAEANQAAIDEVLVTLAALGHKQTVSYIRRFLSASDERMRARAAEAITAVDQRRLVTPLIPLLDGDTAKRGKTLPVESVLEAMSTSSLPWLRRAAVAARSLESDMPNAEHGLLDRLLFLRNVPIFESCSLDDLYAMQQVMKRADYLSDELIVEQGAQGEELFVLLEGEVKVRQRGPSGFDRLRDVETRLDVRRDGAVRRRRALGGHRRCRLRKLPCPGAFAF